MAGYCSKNFDTDTLTSILVPEQYFFDNNLNKITLFYKKNFSFIYLFSSLLTFKKKTQRLISWATAQRNKIYKIVCSLHIV